MSERRLLTAAETAKILGLSMDRVYALIREGIIPAVRLGRLVRIDSVALEEWIRQGGKAYPGGWKKEA